MDILLEGQPIFETAQLIFTRGVDIHPDERVLQQIYNNFDRQKGLSIYVAAGKLGTGKSSHQNVILKRLSNNLANRSAPFDVQMVTTTLTQGVWVYPYPLYAPNQPNIQILLIDIEGMDSVKDADVGDTMLNLMKLYTFGMILSSVFSVHTEMKPDQTTLTILQKAFDVCRIFKSQLNIESPKLFLLMKDVDPLRMLNAIQHSRELIQKHLANYPEERSQLIIKGKCNPHETFKDSTSRDCRQLVGTQFLGVVDELIQVISHSPKIDPTSVNSPITLEGFKKLVKTACDLLNNKDFEGSLITAIDYIKLEILNQVYTESLTECVDNSLEKAKTVPLNVSIQYFRAELTAYVDGCIKLFEDRVSKVIKSSTTIRNWTEKHRAIFRATTLSMGAVEIFTRRKIAAEENEELKMQHEEVLKQQTDLTEKAKKSAEILQNQIIKMDQEHKEALEKTQKEYDEKLRKAAQEALEKIKALEERGEVMEEEHRRKLVELGNKYQADLQRCEAEMLKRKKELEILEQKRKADEEKYNIKMQELQKESFVQLNKVGKEAEEKHRELERRMHEAEKAWNKENFDRKLANETEMNKLRIQLSQVQAARDEKKGGGIFDFLTGIFTEPLKGLATSIVKLFT